eukprot:Em0002g669a
MVAAVEQQQNALQSYPMHPSALPHALKHNTTLSELWLEECGLRDEAICELCDGLKWCKLKRLEFKYNPIGDQGAKGLADVLKDHPTLEELEMRGSDKMSDDGVQYLMDAMMSNARVKMLRLDLNYEHLIVPKELMGMGTSGQDPSLLKWKHTSVFTVPPAPPLHNGLADFMAASAICWGPSGPTHKAQIVQLWIQLGPSHVPETATCCLNGKLYPCHMGSSYSWCSTAMYMVKHMVQVHMSSTALRLTLTTSRPGRITWTSSLLEKGQLFRNTLPDQKSILKGQTALDRASDKGVIVIVQELTPNVNTKDKALLHQVLCIMTQDPIYRDYKSVLGGEGLMGVLQELHCTGEFVQMWLAGGKDLLYMCVQIEVSQGPLTVFEKEI